MNGQGKDKGPAELRRSGDALAILSACQAAAESITLVFCVYWTLQPRWFWRQVSSAVAKMVIKVFVATSSGSTAVRISM